MNIHPLIVHFPIALLSVYSLLEVIRRFTPGHKWLHARAVLVITGTIGAFFSLSSGETAEHLYQNRDLHAVLEMHSLMANITTWIYAILAACYLLHWLKVDVNQQKLPGFVRTIIDGLSKVSSVILRTPLAPLLALIAFLALGFVGGLGGILVYGPEFDPVTSLIYSTFFSN